MVCCARDFPVLWTIVRGWRRRESESLHDRARSGRLRALNVAPSVSFLVSVRGRSREGIPAAAGGLHAASLAIRLRVSCYAPMRPPPHPRAPSRLATLMADCRAESSARNAGAHDPALTQQRSRTVSPTRVARTQLREPRDPTASLLDARGGSERSARRSPCA